MYYGNDEEEAYWNTPEARTVGWPGGGERTLTFSRRAWVPFDDLLRETALTAPQIIKIVIEQALRLGRSFEDHFPQSMSEADAARESQMGIRERQEECWRILKAMPSPEFVRSAEQLAQREQDMRRVVELRAEIDALMGVCPGAEVTS